MLYSEWLLSISGFNQAVECIGDQKEGRTKV